MHPFSYNTANALAKTILEFFNLKYIGVPHIGLNVNQIVSLIDVNCQIRKPIKMFY